MTVDLAELRDHAEELSTRRRRLRALVEDRGWDWSTDVLGTSSEDRGS